MKDILDIVIVIMFVFMVAMFIINFNRQQIKKHTDKVAKNEEKHKANNETKDKIDA